MSKEKNDQQAEQNEQKDAILNLVNDLVKNENSLDLGSILRMATNLLSDDSLMKSVKDIGQFNATGNPELQQDGVQDAGQFTQLPNPGQAAAPPAQKKSEYALLAIQFEQFANDVEAMKADLKTLKQGLAELTATKNKSEEKSEIKKDKKAKKKDK